MPRLRLSDFDFELPPERIAQTPAPERDAARLLCVRLPGGVLSHHRMRDLPALLRPGDLLVANDSRVIPARLRGRTATGGRVELLLLRPVGPRTWEVLARPARRAPAATRLSFGEGVLEARVVEVLEGGRRRVELAYEGDLFALLERVGTTPLPPYIKRPAAREEGTDRERYQTVYAREPGSVAAPTAGLHFTPRLLAALGEAGIGWASLTLHVGYGTFQPIRTEIVEGHRMEEERFSIPAATAEAIAAARRRRARVVAVGTTTVRALESAARDDGSVRPGAGTTSLFIYPGYRFRVVDALLTNFHLPRSSLLLLVAAFAGPEIVRRAYEEALREGYRFYSYGDAMLVLPAAPRAPGSVEPAAGAGG